MPYTPPPLAQFTAAFPAFAAVTQETYDFWSTDAARQVEQFTDCLGDRIDLAAMRATAWLLTDAGIGTGTDAQMAAQGAQGFKSIRSGSLSLERGDSASADAAGIYGTNAYGLAYWGMIKPCLAGPRVTGTGYLPGGCGFNGFAGTLPPWQG